MKKLHLAFLLDSGFWILATFLFTLLNKILNRVEAIFLRPCGFHFLRQVSDELCGLVTRDAERLPVRRFEMLGEEHNLSNVISVMRQLAVDGLDDCMLLAAHGTLLSGIV